MLAPMMSRDQAMVQPHLLLRSFEQRKLFFRRDRFSATRIARELKTTACAYANPHSIAVYDRIELLRSTIGTARAHLGAGASGPGLEVLRKSAKPVHDQKSLIFSRLQHSIKGMFKQTDYL